MKVTVNNKEESKGINYPCIMEFIYDRQEKIIVLMTGYKKGVVLLDELNDWDKGEISDTWKMDKFKPFKGSITLSND